MSFLLYMRTPSSSKIQNKPRERREKNTQHSSFRLLIHRYKCHSEARSEKKTRISRRKSYTTAQKTLESKPSSDTHSLELSLSRLIFQQVEQKTLIAATAVKKKKNFLNEIAEWRKSSNLRSISRQKSQVPFV